MTVKADDIYSILLKSYKKQGWWPVYETAASASRYASGAPRNDSEKFEIIIGAILTQNIAWKNVEKALGALIVKKLMSPEILHRTKDQTIASCIRPAGYFNQKTRKIKNFLDWFSAYNYSFDVLKKFKTGTLREKLLEVNGIGPETADSILLYAMNRKIFVVDAYTKRIFSRLQLTGSGDTYDSVQQYFHREFTGGVRKYNEFHALIVAHGKDVCKNKPLCETCCLNLLCKHPETLS
jgi:endonuclease III related protein